MMYDVTIVGAGPAGLMAAKTASEQGLRVVVIEKRGDVSKITRACCQLFIMDEDYEKESIKVKEGKIIFPRNGFEVDYDGPTLNVMDMYHISPNGHRVHFSNRDRSPSAIKFDKGMLLKDLWEKCEKSGVEFRSSTVAYDAKDSAEGVEVSLTCRGTKSTLKAKKTIVADGVNSRIAEALGMNEGRTFFVTAPCIIYRIEGLKDFERAVWKQYYMAQLYQSRRPVIIYPSLEGENVAELVIMGTSDQLPDRIYDDIRTKGPLSDMFKQAKVVSRVGAAVKAITPMRIPYKGNALAIGDVGAFAEVEVQGGLMCGFHGGNAVMKEMRGEGGFEEYTKWWQDSFEFNNEEILMSAMSTLLGATLYTDDDLDYLFALTEDEVLDGSYSQYRMPKLMWDSIFRHMGKLMKERPELHEKIKQIRELSFKELYAPGSHD